LEEIFKFSSILNLLSDKLISCFEELFKLFEELFKKIGLNAFPGNLLFNSLSFFSGSIIFVIV
jgi:hypothetical protein